MGVSSGTSGIADNLGRSCPEVLAEQNSLLPEATGAIDLLIVHTNGHELPVLRGARGLLPQVPRHAATFTRTDGVAQEVQAGCTPSARAIHVAWAQ